MFNRHAQVLEIKPVDQSFLVQLKDNFDSWNEYTIPVSLEVVLKLILLELHKSMDINCALVKSVLLLFVEDLSLVILIYVLETIRHSFHHLV